jgi:hypothetical protein
MNAIKTPPADAKNNIEAPSPGIAYERGKPINPRIGRQSTNCNLPVRTPRLSGPRNSAALPSGALFMTLRPERGSSPPYDDLPNRWSTYGGDRAS